MVSGGLTLAQDSPWTMLDQSHASEIRSRVKPLQEPPSGFPAVRQAARPASRRRERPCPVSLVRQMNPPDGAPTGEIPG
jgi:hypothetical protein